MVLIEEISSEDFPVSPIRQPVPQSQPQSWTQLGQPSQPVHPEASSSSDLASVLHSLSAKLALPDDLLPSFLKEDKPVQRIAEYRSHAVTVLKQISEATSRPEWGSLPIEDQAVVIDNVVRLKGEDDWTSPRICSLVDNITSTVDQPRIAEYTLTHTVRALFTSQHPNISEASRARLRPAGGPEAMGDLHEAQSWKSQAGWGCHNLLRWASASLPHSSLERNLGQVLPPTLVMMDDWEPAWRGRGAWVLTGWMNKLSGEDLSRRGLDQLFLSSLVHSMSLHANPPLLHVLPAALDIVKGMEGQKRADAYTDIVDKDLIAGWAYAPSGPEGRPVLINIANDLSLLCGVLGIGIVRWLKSIIPSLLEPLQYSPSAAQLPHFVANLSALTTLLETLRGTDRVSRWRGQILNVLARLWVQLGERDFTMDEGATEQASTVQAYIRQVFTAVAEMCPSVRENEFQTLLSLDRRVFGPLVGDEVRPNDKSAPEDRQQHAEVQLQEDAAPVLSAEEQALNAPD